jgi:hypothetical protein
VGQSFVVRYRAPKDSAAITGMANGMYRLPQARIRRP